MPDLCLVASFSDPEIVVAVVQKLRQEKMRVHDVYAPYPVHGLDRAMGLRRTRLPLVALTAALSSAAVAILFQHYTAVVDWNLNVGGKPDNSVLAFIPITFELAILAGGLSIVAALLLRTRLFPGSTGGPVVPGVTDDRIAIAVRIRDAIQATRARDLLTRAGGFEIQERNLAR